VAGADRDNTGNTNAIVHGGKLFALREDSWPTELDPDTLETRGKWNFGGKLESKAMTAHPKLDPVTGELWSCGFFVRGRYDRDDMALQVVDRSGRLIREEFFVAPYPGLTHDFAVTRDHVIFPVMPLTVDVERMKRGGPFYAYDPDLPSCFGIMRRDGSTRDIRWFKVRQCFNGHIMNAFSEGSKVHLDGTIAPGNAFGFFPTVTGERSDPSQGIPTITRVTFDLASDDDGAVLTPFSAAIGEMPRCDPRREMSRYRYGYFKTRTGIVKLDWDSGSKTVHEMADSSAQEPVFVPRSADGAEDDGFILCVVNRPLEHRADLVILDAQNMTGPALATVKLPFDQPMAFHGNWVPVTRC
ncbi:MAG: Lignostilbene-alpha,beta-dioxygenase isozyme, partial [Rhodospirillales bacterium]|nr:Lignostilbene-alpha,beta-dioxygenase isozyme [Rhodospirillales bacterium]